MAFVFQNFMDLIKKKNPTYERVKKSDLHDLVELLHGNAPDPVKVRGELEKLSDEKVLKYEAALTYAVESLDSPKVYLFRAVTFDAKIAAEKTKLTITPYNPGKPTAASVKYETPHFRGSAEVLCLKAKSAAWEVGFIQQVDTMVCRMEYTDFWNSWEIPSLPCSDADGTYPWYGKGAHSDNLTKAHQHADMKGKVGRVTIETNDNFAPNVYFYGFDDQYKTSATSRLKLIDRNQSFSCWLAAKCGNEVILIKKAEWRTEVAITTTWKAEKDGTFKSNPTAVAKDTSHKVKVSVPASSDKIDAKCLAKPGANGAQTFCYRPTRDGKLKVLQLATGK